MMAKCPDTFKELPEGATESFTGRKLPEDWLESEVHCVAMAGARASGKSLFLAVMIKQLELLAHERFRRINVEPLDDSTRDRYRENYETPLFSQMKLIPSTSPMSAMDAYQSEPFIYEIGKWPDCDNPQMLRKHYLVLRDVAGEDLENPDFNSEALDFFKYASLIIFLFDPLKVPAISTYLEGLVTTSGDLGDPPEDLFRNLLKILDGTRPPLAIAVSKFDTLQALDGLEERQEWRQIMSNHGAAFRRDDGWYYNEPSIQLLSLEVQSLLEKMGAQELLNLVYENYPEHYYRFFAVSALGQSPRGEKVDRKGIAPYRCLDPLLWMLTSRNAFV